MRSYGKRSFCKAKPTTATRNKALPKICKLSMKSRSSLFQKNIMVSKCLLEYWKWTEETEPKEKIEKFSYYLDIVRERISYELTGHIFYGHEHSRKVPGRLQPASKEGREVLKDDDNSLQELRDDIPGGEGVGGHLLMNIAPVRGSAWWNPRWRTLSK